MNFKKELTTLLVLFFFIGGLTELNGQSLVKNEEDEFTGDRVIQSEFVKIDHEGYRGTAYISAFYVEGTYALVITISSNDSWQLLGTETASFFIDGERESYSLERIGTDVSSDTERYGIMLSESGFNKFGQAEEIKFRAKGNVHTFNKQAINSFSIVLDALDK